MAYQPLANPGATLVALDFDGTLSPIIDDPTQALIHPDAFAAVRRIAPHVAAVAIVTGRPVAQALRLGGFEGAEGLEHLIICGQYGAERWEAATGRIEQPEAPPAIAELGERLPAILARHDAADARLEFKGLAIAVHTRQLGPAVFERLRQPLHEVATELGLHLEPGKQVLEIRANGTDKGVAVRDLIERFGVEHVVYAGDDLGDLPAFEVVAALRDAGQITADLVFSTSTEQDTLESMADVVLDGPEAIAAWLAALVD